MLPAWRPFVALAAILFYSPLHQAAYGLVATTIAFPVLIWLAASASSGRSTRQLVWLGALSYPLYALHDPINAMGEDFLRGVLSSQDPLMVVVSVLYLFGILTIAAFAAFVFDVPGRQHMRRLMSIR
jgi:peptidoglycan/LPS O-acetylase OafA/YrhL